MFGNPLSVCIVTPALNQGAFIESGNRSVLEFWYRKLDYIIVGGGSTDGSLDIIKNASQLKNRCSAPDDGPYAA